MVQDQAANAFSQSPGVGPGAGMLFGIEAGR
jgi:hypothetical protein